MSDAVQRLLEARGCPAPIVAAGLPGLVSMWSEIVATIESGYPLTLDDYLNDMDLRDLLAAAIAVAGPEGPREVEERLTSADARFRAQTMPSPCLWGDDIADEEGLDAEREWWYYRRPTRPGEALSEDLQTWGLT
ncbi:MAG: hypothetical protein IPK85_23590 [Gemmatimonadetes bacterium]|nr:hypothetical protein [Gemmatimonadota bacterium]